MKSKKKNVNNLDKLVGSDRLKEIKKGSKPLKKDPKVTHHGVSDSVRDTIISFRDKGYDDNQIASLLHLHKQVVEQVK